MRCAVLSIVFLSLTATAFGQPRGTYWSLGGFGNVLYPGTGHAPQTPPGGITGPDFASRFGATVAGRPVFTNPVPAGHQQHRRTVIVPYPVYYGGYAGYDPSVGYAQGYQEQLPPIINTNTAPSVVINQSYVPQQTNPQVREYAPEPDTQSSGLRTYQNNSRPYADTQAEQPRSRVAPDDKPTIYLIAFKDHSIVQALGYWMEGQTLHYVSVEHSLNQASITLIDRELSQRLNDERNVEFKLPASLR